MTIQEPSWLVERRRRFMRPDALRYLKSGISGYGTRHDREIVREAKAEQPQAGLDERTFRYELGMLKLELALIKTSLQARRRRWQAKTYNPEQPRVPAGSPDGGQWTDANGNSLRSSADEDDSVVIAGVIRICVAGSRSLATDYRGNKSFKVTYDCFGGNTVTRSGTGHRFPTLIIDPYQ
jgi:hypothetical protein